MTSITGIIYLPTGAPYKGRVIFTPTNTPAAVIVEPTAVLLTKRAVFATDDNGELVSCSLKPLTYTVTFDTTELDTIYGVVVPDTDSVQDFALLTGVAESAPSIVTSNESDLNMSGGTIKIYNVTTGKYHRVALEGAYPAIRWIYGPEEA